MRIGAPGLRQTTAESESATSSSRAAEPGRSGPRDGGDGERAHLRRGWRPRPRRSRAGSRRSASGGAAGSRSSSRTGPTSCSCCCAVDAARRDGGAAEPRLQARRVRVLPRRPAARAAARPRRRAARRPARRPRDVQVVDVSREGRARSCCRRATRSIEDETRVRAGRPDDVALAAAHERHDEPAEAGAAAAAQPRWRRRGRSPPSTGSAPTTSRTARCRCSTCTAWSPRRSPRSPAAGRWSCRGGSRRARSGRRLATHGVTWFSAGPTLHQMLLERDRRRRAPRDAPLRALVQLGALARADAAARGGATACRCWRRTA